MRVLLDPVLELFTPQEILGKLHKHVIRQGGACHEAHAVSQL